MGVTLDQFRGFISIENKTEHMKIHGTIRKHTISHQSFGKTFVKIGQAFGAGAAFERDGVQKSPSFQALPISDVCRGVYTIITKYLIYKGYAVSCILGPGYNPACTDLPSFHVEYY